MFQYRISNGELLHDGQFIGTGYSGRDPYKNDASAIRFIGLGPIPIGAWRISEPYYDTHRGKNSFHLSPREGTETFGRNGFLIHGDNVTHTASSGCIILGPTIRHYIAKTKDHDLMVIP